MVATAIVFPGQGSQSVGMLSQSAEEFSLIKETFSEASDVLGYDLWALSQTGPQESLNLTETTQPLLLTSSVALWRVWQEQGGSAPAYMAGHSLGEYSALVCADVLSFADAVALVRNRGRYMQEAVPVGTGAMAAVLGLQDEQVSSTCAELSRDDAIVEAVNFNSPGQVVIAGHANAVEQAGAALKSLGAKRVMPLPVSAPFHTSLMRGAGERLAADMSALSFNAPSVPVVHNVHAETESDPEAIRELMIRQTSSPVRWTSCMQVIINESVDRFVECGPGKALAGMLKKIDRAVTTVSIEQPDSLREAL